MNTFLIFVGLFALCVGIALRTFVIYKNLKNEQDMPIYKKIAVLGIVVGLIVFVFGNCFVIVPTGHTGVCTTFGQVSQHTVGKGLNFKVPFVQSIELVNNKQQDVKVDTEVWGETIEKTPVFAKETIITYQINSEKSAWLYSNVSNPKELVSPSLVASAIKSSMVELSVTDVTNRSKIETLVKDKLQTSVNEKFGEDTVYVLKVVINNMDFEDSYNEAIAAKSIAQQTYEKQKIENAAAVEKAEANKKVTVANAEAKAEATQIEAKAQADANKLLADSLTDDVLQSRFYDTWNGELPTVMGENTVITDIGKAKTETK